MYMEIDKNSDIPVYMQIVFATENAVNTGKIQKGYKMPTVRELALKVGVSKGTVKHAYDELERRKIVEMIQGRGTFVLFSSKNVKVEEQTAPPTAIDIIIKELEDVSHGEQDAEMIRNLKIQLNESAQSGLRVAFISCCPEQVDAVMRQLVSIPNVFAQGFLLEEIRYMPFKLDDSFDLILVPTVFYEDIIESIAILKPIVEKVNVKLTDETRQYFESIEIDQNILIYCQSYNFFVNSFMESLKDFDNINKDIALILANDAQNLEDVAAGCDVLILACSFSSYIKNEDVKVIENFARSGGSIMFCAYGLENSLIKKISAKARRLKP